MHADTHADTHADIYVATHAEMRADSRAGTGGGIRAGAGGGIRAGFRANTDGVMTVINPGVAALLFGSLATGVRSRLATNPMGRRWSNLLPVPRRAQPMPAPHTWHGVAPDHEDACQALAHQASRCVVLGVLGYRALAVTIPLVVLLVTYGSGEISGLLGLAVMLVAGNIAAAVAVQRRPHLTLAQAGPLVLADLAVAFGANLYASATLQSVSTHHQDVFWGYLAGTIALVTAAWGIVGGLFSVVASVPLQMLMSSLDGPAVSLGAGEIATRFVWLAAGLVIPVLVMAFVAWGSRVAVAQGIRAGRAAERARVLRDIHDGVLQTLEAMSLSTSLDRTAPTAALVELRITARAQALLLRRTLDELAGERNPRLGAALSEVAAETVRRGVRAQLVIADFDDTSLTPDRGEAIRDAVREALTNTAKHAGVTSAVVRVDRTADGVEVVVRDQGVGFEITDAALGFGIRESIIGRLQDVGGTATVASAPGEGTRVRLWVPL